ncbi:putative fatty acyl-CoA reductase CG5065 [Phlebotomus argentipes]|uniref:putative fatty acyl-CoA reductase CG5065 n=1 Tax=Phlebotomus argentipes TaxID=94469 RepID=UPI002892E0C3|nr:putative fatty acyl-CoA reductase CG5065 [Phlebotomus argentipes]
MQDRMRIPEWYAGRSVFITGATGFMGKVLVEKLLHDCPDLERLYLLVRAKRGVEPEQRREEYVNHMAFERVRQVQPKRLEKIHMIKGDVTLDDLGLSEVDRAEVTAKVSVIFHCAANVRFDQALKEAVNMNTQGTYRVLKLAETVTNLDAFVHVSTAYCQCDEPVLEERGYPAPHSPLGIVQMTNLLDDDLLEHITPKLLKTLPNTYAYTKALTEDLVASFKGKFPIAIARPSIVTAAINEPYPGWVEGTNGPTGLMVGAGRGVIRSMHCNPNYPADAIPVDITMNTILALAWQRGQNKSPEIQYTNVVASTENSLSWGESIERGKAEFYKNPLCFSLWYPNGSIKSNYFHHLFCVIFFHYLPAYFIDLLLVIFRKKPFMVRVQNKVSMGLKVLQYYTTKRWDFKNTNMMNLFNSLDDRDKEIFNFNCESVDWHLYISNYIYGVRTYLLKEPPSTLPQARKLLNRLYILDKLVTFIFYGLLLWLVWSYLDVIGSSVHFVFEQSKNLLTKSQVSH